MFCNKNVYCPQAQWAKQRLRMFQELAQYPTLSKWRSQGSNPGPSDHPALHLITPLPLSMKLQNHATHRVCFGTGEITTVDIQEGWLVTILQAKRRELLLSPVVCTRAPCLRAIWTRSGQLNYAVSNCLSQSDMDRSHWNPEKSFCC